MTFLILFIFGSIFIVDCLEIKTSRDEQLLGDPTVRRGPSKRFFLLPKYLLRHTKAREHRHSAQPEPSLESESAHQLTHVNYEQLFAEDSPPLLGQLPVRQERQEMQTDKLAQAHLQLQPQLEDMDEQYIPTDPTASGNSISRPCYFSPVQCLLNVPEERINNLVDFVIPVVVVHEANEREAEEQELDNNKRVRSTENKAKLESIRKAASGLLGAQQAAQEKILDFGEEAEDEELDTPLTRLPPLRTRLGGSMGPNGFGLLPSANGMNNGGQTSARSLAKMFLTQRHATRLGPFMVNENQPRLGSRSS